MAFGWPGAEAWERLAAFLRFRLREQNGRTVFGGRRTKGGRPRERQNRIRTTDDELPTERDGTEAEASAAVRSVLEINGRRLAPQDHGHRCIRSRCNSCASHSALRHSHESGHLPNSFAGHARARRYSSPL